MKKKIKKNVQKECNPKKKIPFPKNHLSLSN